MSEATLDPVTLAVLKGRLEQIADEMATDIKAMPNSCTPPRR